MRGLNGKIAVVTGGAQGLGEAIVRRLSEEGSVVWLLDIQQSGAETARRIQEKTGNLVHFVQTDISDEQSVQTAFERIDQVDKQLHILVNNAAVFHFKGVDASDDDWNRIVDVNIKGTSRVTKHATPMLKRTGNGSIINLSSISGFVGQHGFTTYNTTKFALRGMAKCWAIELAAAQIRVNTVCPGYIWTSAFEDSCRQLGMDIEEEDRRVSSFHILGRQGKPDEVAGAVAFLASDDASFITGSDLLVDGGYLAQ